MFTHPPPPFSWEPWAAETLFKKECSVPRALRSTRSWLLLIKPLGSIDYFCGLLGSCRVAASPSLLLVARGIGLDSLAPPGEACHRRVRVKGEERVLVDLGSSWVKH